MDTKKKTHKRQQEPDTRRRGQGQAVCFPESVLPALELGLAGDFGAQDFELRRADLAALSRGQQLRGMKVHSRPRFCFGRGRKSPRPSSAVPGAAPAQVSRGLRPAAPVLSAVRALIHHLPPPSVSPAPLSHPPHPAFVTSDAAVLGEPRAGRVADRKSVV